MFLVFSVTSSLMVVSCARTAVSYTHLDVYKRQVLGKDRSGIVAEVATALAECGANIDDISQTILDDIFSMTMLTTLNTEVADFNTVQEKLEAVGESLGVQIIVQREDVFQMMYKI